MLRWLIAFLAARTSISTDDVWIVDSIRGRVRAFEGNAEPFRLAGWAEYGYCASHSRFFWGLRLHWLCTLLGLPVAFALAVPRPTNARRCSACSRPTRNPVAARPEQKSKTCGRKIIHWKAFEGVLAYGDGSGAAAPGPRKDEKPWPAHRYFKPFRQVIESINKTLEDPA